MQSDLGRVGLWLPWSLTGLARFLFFFPFHICTDVGRATGDGGEASSLIHKLQLQQALPLSPPPATTCKRRTPVVFGARGGSKPERKELGKAPSLDTPQIGKGGRSELGRGLRAILLEQPASATCGHPRTGLLPAAALYHSMENGMRTKDGRWKQSIAALYASGKEAGGRPNDRPTFTFLLGRVTTIVILRKKNT